MRVKNDFIKNWQTYLLGLPALILFVIFTIVPLYGIIIAFQNYNVLDGYASPWQTPLFANFEFFFKSVDFGRTTRNVFLFNTFGLVFGTSVTLTFALLLNEVFSNFAKKFYQSVLFLPYFLSLVVLGKLVSMMTNFENGVINNIIKLFGGTPQNFDSMTWPWFFIVHLASTWHGIGYGLILYLATLSGIDETLYEAAKIDGAGRFKQITKITLPMLTPLIMLNFLLSVGRIFNGDFLLIQSIVGFNTAALTWTDNIETFIYRSMMQTVPPRYGMMTAVGLYQSILGCVLIFASNFIVKRINKDYALF